MDLYGPSFTTIYGEEPSAIWIAEIAKLTDAECSAGLLALASGTGRPADRHSYPANLVEFREACKPKSPGRRYLGVPTNARALEHQRGEPASREFIEARLANMRSHVATRRVAEREPGSDDETGGEPPTPNTDDACKCPLDEPGTCAVCRKFMGYLSSGRPQAAES